MRILRLLGLTLVLMCGACQSQQSSAHHEPGVALLVLGDSLSAGYGIDPTKGWVTLMEQDMRSQAILIEGQSLVNASVSGETSQGGLERLPDLLQEHQPRIVAIELGANDMLRRQPMNTLKSNLMEMIELSQQSGAKVVLINVELPFIAQLAGTQLEQVYGEVAKEAKVPVIDYPLGSLFNKQGMMLPDRLHPTEAAQEGLKEAMAPGLIKIVQE